VPAGKRLSPTLFYLRAVARFAVLPVARRAIRGRYRRTPTAVRAEYDAQRSDFLERFRASDWSLDDYIMHEAGDDLDTMYYFASVIDGKLVQGGGTEVRQRLLDRLKLAVEMYDASSVIEVGAGTGRNLFFLKSQMPYLRAVGLELSPPSVEAARQASRRYDIDARFEVCDVTGPWPVDMADVVFSVHAVEQIPNSEPVLRTMTEHARKAVVLFEPLPDLWRGLPRIAGRLRASYLDRLRGGAVDRFDVRRKMLLADGMALNRTTEVHLAPSAHRP
jgi:SAM-dependent methyltransferase